VGDPLAGFRRLFDKSCAFARPLQRESSQSSRAYACADARARERKPGMRWSCWGARGSLPPPRTMTRC